VPVPVIRTAAACESGQPHECGGAAGSRSAWFPSWRAGGGGPAGDWHGRC
jgi:hypothetical protein